MARPLDIGTALPAARRAAGLSQRELGARVGVAQQQIARWEASGYRGASLERVDDVTQALGYGTRDVTADQTLLAAETAATYGANGATTTALAAPAVTPVRDLGEIAARIRANSREFAERFGIVRIGVFGSFAYGEQTETSDVALLVEMPEPGGFLFVEAAQHMEDLLGREVDFVRAEGLHARLRDRVLKDAVYVWAA
jgi:hypothetical protein